MPVTLALGYFHSKHTLMNIYNITNVWIGAVPRINAISHHLLHVPRSHAQEPVPSTKHTETTAAATPGT